MYYLQVVVMVSSSLSVRKTFRMMMLLHTLCQLSLKFKNAWSWRVVVALTCLTFAMVSAPESPQKLASICERHNPEVVCQVW